MEYYNSYFYLRPLDLLWRLFDLLWLLLDLLWRRLDLLPPFVTVYPASPGLILDAANPVVMPSPAPPLILLENVDGIKLVLFCKTSGKTCFGSIIY